MHWNALVLIISLIFALFAVIKEYRRANKQRLGLRIAATLTGIAALAAIALPLSYSSQVDKAVNEAVLLTEGYNADSLGKYKLDTVYTFDAVIKNQYPKAKLVTVDELKQEDPAISELRLLGFGLPEYDLKQLDSIPLIFNPGPNPSGIITASWASKLKQGEPLSFQGKYHNTGNKEIHIILKELNTTVDSVTIKKQGIEDFQLSHVPKSTGKITEQLIVLQDKDTLENESVPLIVEPVQPLNVLILAASPGFENKFLKNWLTEKNFGVAVRSAISKDKFSTEFTNLQKMPLTHLSAGTLNKFDVLIADRLALQTLSAAEQSSVKQEINQNGLGLIIKSDTALKTGTPFQADFSVYKAIEQNPKPLAIQLQGTKSVLKVSNTGQLFIRDKSDMQTLASDIQNRPLAAAGMAGLGKVVCITLDNTYTWMLAGNKDDYGAFWSLIIGRAAKTAPQTENWAIVNPFPVVNTPVAIQLETAQQPGQMELDGERASPVQNTLLPFQWQSTFWPGKTGWQAVNHTNGVVQWLYMYNRYEWASVKAVNNSTATKKYALQTKVNGVTKQIQQEVKVLIPKGYFYILLLLCCTFLWVEDKLSAGTGG